MKKKKFFRGLMISLMGVLMVMGVIMWGGVKTVGAYAQEGPIGGNGKVFWRNLLYYGSWNGGANSYDRNTALDSNNYPHRCVLNPWGDGTMAYLFHVYWNGSDWITEQIEGYYGTADSFGKYCAIAVNRNNNEVHVSYAGHDSTNYFLRYAKRDTNGTWYKKAGDINLGSFTSIALNSASLPFISYRDFANDDLGVIYQNTEGTWTNNHDLDTTGDTGYFTSIAIDADNNVHISYFNTTDNSLYYARRLHDTWASHKIVEAGSGSIEPGNYGASIAVGSDNVIRIAYDRYSSSGGGSSSLYYAYSNDYGNNWFINSVDAEAANSSGSYPSIALDSNNTSYISYRDASNGDLKYAYGSPGSWTKTTIDSGENVGQFSSIAYGNSNAYISYYNVTDSKADFVLVDPVAPTGSTEVTGKSGNSIAWSLTSSDYAQMGGARYYCADATNTCDPTTALSAATASGNVTASDNTVYVRLKDWAGNVGSLTATHTPAKEEVSEKQELSQDILGEKIVNYDLSYIWKKLPKHPSKYWIQTTRYNKYPKPKYVSKEKKAVKRYWKIKTNLYKYRKAYRDKLIKAEDNYIANKSGKSEIKKYRKKMFLVKFTFYYTKKLVKNLQKKNSDLKGLKVMAAKKKLWLKFYNSKTKKWVNMSKLKLVNKTTANWKKNTFSTDLRYFRWKNTLAGIGVR